jgi:nucleoside-diphosphate-sugar epimerase
VKVLVTGCAGFIGSALVAKLLSQPSVTLVVGIDSFTDYYSKSAKESNIAESLSHPKFQLVSGDILETDVGVLLNDVEVVFHEAGQPGVRSSWGDEFALYTDRNVLATQRLLEAARKCQSLRRFVYASSSSVYGNATSYPTTEQTPTHPLSPYGVTKLAAEHMCVLYARNYGVPTVSLRYFTVYGPRQRPDMLFSRLMKAAFGKWELELFGTGEQVRDFTYIDDIVAANLAVGFKPVPEGAVFNVSGGSNVSVNQVIEIVNSFGGKGLSYSVLAPVKGDVTRTGGDSSRLALEVNWAPEVTIEDGLKSMFDHYEDLYGNNV